MCSVHSTSIGYNEEHTYNKPPRKLRDYQPIPHKRRFFFFFNYYKLFSVHKETEQLSFFSITTCIEL